MNPSGPGLFPLWNEDKIAESSSSVTSFIRSYCISSVINFGNKFSDFNISLMGHPGGAENLFLKWSTATLDFSLNDLAILPSSSFISSIVLIFFL